VSGTVGRKPVTSHAVGGLAGSWPICTCSREWWVDITANILKIWKVWLSHSMHIYLPNFIVIWFEMMEPYTFLKRVTPTKRRATATSRWGATWDQFLIHRPHICVYDLYLRKMPLWFCIAAHIVCRNFNQHLHHFIYYDLLAANNLQSGLSSASLVASSTLRLWYDRSSNSGTWKVFMEFISWVSGDWIKLLWCGIRIVPSVLWCLWLGDKNGIQPVNTASKPLGITVNVSGVSPEYPVGNLAYFKRKV